MKPVVSFQLDYSWSFSRESRARLIYCCAFCPLQLTVGSEEHPLQHAYSMWFSCRIGSKQAGTLQKFEDSLKLLATFRTVEKFWKCYTHLRFPNELVGHADYHLFKYGVKPMWEVCLCTNSERFLFLTSSPFHIDSSPECRKAQSCPMSYLF